MYPQLNKKKKKSLKNITYQKFTKNNVCRTNPAGQGHSYARNNLFNLLEV